MKLRSVLHPVRRVMCALVVLAMAGAGLWLYRVAPSRGWFLTPEVTREHVHTIAPEVSARVVDRLGEFFASNGASFRFVRDSYRFSRLVNGRGERLVEWAWECRFQIRCGEDRVTVPLRYKLLDGEGRVLSSSKARGYTSAADWREQTVYVRGTGTMPTELLPSVRRSEWVVVIEYYGEEDQELTSFNMDNMW